MSVSSEGETDSDRAAQLKVNNSLILLLVDVIPMQRSNVFLSPSAIGKGVAENAFLIEQLEELANTYRNIGDEFRAYAYRRAISSIKRYPRRISTTAVRF